MTAYLNIIPYITSVFAVFLAGFVLRRDWYSFVHRILAVGFSIVAVESVFTGLSANAIMPADALLWLHLRNYATALLPGVWLLFSLSFSRANYYEFISRWKWVWLAFFILPIAIIFFFKDTFFIGQPLVSFSSIWLVRLGWPGYTFQLLILLGSLLILMNLERTLRNSTGRLRWQIKFMVLGVGCMFAVRIYTASQSILYYFVNVSLDFLNDGAVIVAGLLILRSLFRTRILNVDFYLSQTFLYNSFTILFVGIYLISVGIVAKITLFFNGGENIPLRAFFVLIGLLGLFALLLSDRVKKRLRRFISRHFHRPLYDYRKEWTKFTESTTLITDIKELCTIIVTTISQAFEVLSVSIWLYDDSDDHVHLCGSTGFPENSTGTFHPVEQAMKTFLQIYRRKSLPEDFDFSTDELPADYAQLSDNFFEEAMIRWCIPLRAGNHFLGVITLYDRVGGEALSVEDFDLLGNIADQSSASLLNLMLSERLQEAKKMEAFQTMSAFFVHDLKNLASKLSLTMQNLPIHFDNPEFRHDALRSISQSVEKIKLMENRLTSLSQKLDIHPIETNINDVVNISVSDINGLLKEKVRKELDHVPPVKIDVEQIQNVLTNLILNAHDATDEKGEIIISTSSNDGWVTITVRDNGSGMSREFIESSLFQPFKTTKQKGMGIGLYHSKTIVEAHKGRIEVESELGKGSTFRVVLPIKSGK